jgi:hypothetical protein
MQISSPNTSLFHLQAGIKNEKRQTAKNESHFLPFFATLKCIKKDALKKY